MKIRHKQTKEVTDLNFLNWKEEYIARGIDINYDILSQDTVLLRTIDKNGTRSFLREIERYDAIVLVKKNPFEYEFLEKTETFGKIKFKVLDIQSFSFDDFVKSYSRFFSKQELEKIYFRLTGKKPQTRNDEQTNKIDPKLISQYDDNIKLPIVEITNNEKKYLEEVYKRFLEKKDNDIKPYALIANLWKNPPKDFVPEKINSNLIRYGSEITVLGINQIDNNSKYVQYVNQIILTIKELIHENEFLKDIYSNEINHRLNISQEDIYLSFKLINRMENFSRGYGINNQHESSLHIDSEECYQSYFEFDNLENYYLAKLNNDISSKIDKDEITNEEIRKETSTSFVISENVDAVIGAKEQAEEMMQLLVDLESESGQMIGLFGRWGRGKTFFWKEMKKKFEEKGNPFHLVEFHAWKYQDTPASWAYLFEEIAKEFTNSSKYLVNKSRLKVLNINRFKLNLKKYGNWTIIKFIISILIIIGWYFLIAYEIKFNLLIKFLSFICSLGITLSGFIGIYKLYSKIPKAKDLFEKYTSIPSFKELLGFQSEIQGELITLLETWIPDNQKRLLIFVDDIDRCDEKKIIQVIDSFKVMLEDPNISQKIVVLIAIDERILKLAIKHKYYDLINCDFDIIDKKEKLNILSREYMDKLFLAGIKLGTLNVSEKEDIFDSLTTIRHKVHYKVENLRDVDESEYPPNIKTFFKEVQEVGENLKLSSDNNFIEANPEFEIEEFEYILLKHGLSHFNEATPRAIRIYYYRYLLAKRLMKYRITTSSALYKPWHELRDRKILLPLIIIKYSSEFMIEDIYQEKEQITNNQDDVILYKIYNKEYVINKKLLLEIFNIIEMVVPY